MILLQPSSRTEHLNSMFIRCMAAVVMLFAVAGSAEARTPARKIQFVCPLTGETFDDYEGGSFFSLRQTMDFEPMAMGMIRGSQLDTPACPDSGLPLYRDFTEAELKSLREIVGTAEWQRRRALRNTNYLIAHLQLLLNEGDEAIASSVLKAFWYAHSDSKVEVTEAALRAWSVQADRNRGTDSKSVRANWLRIEILRQSGAFEQAGLWLAEFRQASPEAFGEMTPLMIAEEQRLIDTRNDRPAPAPRQERRP